MEYCTFVEPQQGSDYDDQLAFARLTEDAGFDGFFRSDHYLRIGEGDALPGSTDAWTTLAGLARETRRIRLGTLVSSAAHRLPGVLAVQVAQVDAMSGGRVELGLGAGWFDREQQAYGIPTVSRRFDVLEEQLQIISGMWSTPVGASFNFTGDHYRLVDSPALPKPIQSTVPIIIGGGGPRRTPALAARYAQEFNTGFQSDEVIRERFLTVHRACESIGRDPATMRLSAGFTTVVGSDESVIARRTAALGAFDSEFVLRGTAGEVVDRVGRLSELGVDRIYFQLIDLHDLDHLNELAADVLPQLPRGQVAI